MIMAYHVVKYQASRSIVLVIMERYSRDYELYKSTASWSTELASSPFVHCRLYRDRLLCFHDPEPLIDARYKTTSFFIRTSPFILGHRKSASINKLFIVQLSYDPNELSLFYYTSTPFTRYSPTTI